MISRKRYNYAAWRDSASAAKYVSSIRKATPLMLFTLCGKRNMQRGLHSMGKMHSFHVLSQHFEKRILASSCPSVCTEQHSFHCTDFHKLLFWRIFRKSVEKIQVSLISDKNNGYFAWRQICIYDHISLSPSQNKKWFTQSCRENQNIHFTVNNFFPENRAVKEITWKKIWYSRTGHRWQYGACPLHAGYLSLQTHT